MPGHYSEDEVLYKNTVYKYASYVECNLLFIYLIFQERKARTSLIPKKKIAAHGTILR